MSLAVHMADARALHARAVDADLARDDDVVHDLRVALRRCRSLAQGLGAIDLVNAASWKALAKQAKTLFDGLGALRDAQVMIEHAEKLLPGHDAIHTQLKAPTTTLVQQAQAAVAAFDVVAWDERAAAMPPLAEAALRRRPLLLHLALTRFDEGRALHVLAMRHRTPTSLHDTRIGVKRLRYTLESLLPAVHDRIAKPLKKMQEFLGDLHDLDVLADAVRAGSVDGVDGVDGADGALTVIAAARAELLASYKALAAGRGGAWAVVRRALPVDDDVVLRCRRQFVIEVAQSIGVDGRQARRCERAAITLAKNDGAVLSPLQRCAAVLAPARKGPRKRAVRALLGVADDDRQAIRDALRTAVIQAARTFVR